MKNKKFLLSLIALLLICIGVLSIYLFNVINRESLSIKYLSSDTSTISVYDEDLNTVELIRGSEVKLSDKIKKIDNQEYYKIYLDDKT